MPVVFQNLQGLDIIELKKHASLFDKVRFRYKGEIHYGPIFELTLNYVGIAHGRLGDIQIKWEDVITLYHNVS